MAYFAHICSVGWYCKNNLDITFLLFKHTSFSREESTVKTLGHITVSYIFNTRINPCFN